MAVLVSRCLSRARTSLVVVIAAVAACQQTDTTPVVAAPLFSLSLAGSPQAGTVLPGQSTQVLLTARWNGLSDPGVVFRVQNLPAGISSTITNGVVSGSAGAYTVTSTMTLFASTTAPAGVFDLPISAVGAGNASADFLLTVGTAPPPTYTILATPATVTTTPGGSATMAVTVVPVNNFTGTVNLTALNVPAGITASFSSATATNTTGSVLTVQAASTLAPGTYNFTIDGNDAPLDATSTVAVVVANPPPFTLTANPASLVVITGNVATSTITLTPGGGFAGAVTLAASGLPAGATLTFSPVTITSAVPSVVTVTTSASLAAGAYSINISGTSGATSANTSLVLTATTTTNMKFDLAGCAAPAAIPLVAYQDGSGPWTVLTGTDSLYPANVFQRTAGLIYVVAGAGGTYSTNVIHFGRTELLNATYNPCPFPSPGPNTITAAVTNVAATNQAFLGFGGAVATATPATASVTFNNVPDTTLDLFGASISFTGGTNRFFLLHGITAANGTSAGTVNFLGANSGAATSSSVTTNVFAGEALGATMSLHTGPSCLGGPLWTTSNLPNPFNAPWIPAALTTATDFTALMVSATTATTSRTTEAYSSVAGSLQMPLPALLTGTSVANSVVGTNKVLNASVNIPPDIASPRGVLVYSTAGQAQRVSVTNTSGFTSSVAGTTTFAFAVPDMHTLPGFIPLMMPAAGQPVTWSITAMPTAPVSACTQGATNRTSAIFGTN